jgi:ABC-type nitrate/sulfonate/bicarbonate transport system permease component
MKETDPYGRITPNRASYSPLGLAILAWAVVLGLYFFYLPGRVSPLKFPPPDQVFSAWEQLRGNGLTHAGATLLRVVLGFLIGAVLGISLGSLMFASRHVEAVSFGFIEALRPVPPIALIPFFILWFQLHPGGQIGLISLGCFMVFVVSTHEALGRVSLDVRRAAYSLGIRGVRFYLRVMLPAIVPHLVAPARVAMALAFSLATAAEMMGAQEGIGYVIMLARRTLNTETILFGLIILGLEAALLDFLLRLGFRRLTRWHG